MRPTLRTALTAQPMPVTVQKLHGLNAHLVSFFLLPITLKTFTPGSLVFSSTLLSNDYPTALAVYGDLMGEWIEEGVHNGRPYFKQRTVKKSKNFIYYHEGISGEWRLGPKFDGTNFKMANINTGMMPPSYRWYFKYQVQDRNKEWWADTTLYLQPGPLLTCTTVQITLPDYLGNLTQANGRYRLTDIWNEGQPVYQKESHCLAVSFGAWKVMSGPSFLHSLSKNTLTGREYAVINGFATENPGMVEADFAYYGRGDWISDQSIQVTCGKGRRQ